MSKLKSELSNEVRVFFPGINALRFFAALGVIITHIELLKSAFGLKNYWNLPVFFDLGSLGVYFFFVLSGFLITFLLLKEKERSGTIKIKEFYMRRILRIWPLYYLICIIGFFILPQFENIQISYLEENFGLHFQANLVLYLVMLPNLAFSMYTAVPHIGQTWSIGVEEQFYIAWPWIIAKSKNVLRTLVVIICSILLIKVITLLLGSSYSVTDWYKTLKNFVAMSKFECMAIGGIGAYYLHVKKQSMLKLVTHSRLFLISIVLILLLIYFTPEKLQDGIHLVYSFLFLGIILKVALNKKANNFLENKYFSYLGKISYGIYMYHFMIIPFVIISYKYFGLGSNEWIMNAYVYLLSIALTILVSGLSYAFFESKFIRLKRNFTVIESGDHSEKSDDAGAKEF